MNKTILISVILILAVYIFMNRQIITVTTDIKQGVSYNRVEVINKITGNVKIIYCNQESITCVMQNEINVSSK